MLRIFLLVLFSLQLLAKVPDVLVYTRSSVSWNAFLLDELQVFSNNLKLNVDPYKYIMDEDILYNNKSIEDFVSEGGKKLISDIEEASGISILELQPEIKLEGFGYKLSQIKPMIIPSEIDNGVKLSSSVELFGLAGFAKSLSLNFVLNDKESASPIHVLDIKILNPVVKLRDTEGISFELDLDLIHEGDETLMDFTRADFSRISNKLNSMTELIDIKYDDVEIPNVELKLMGRDITVNANKIKEIVEVNKVKIKQILISQIQALFERNGALEILKHFDGKRFKNNRWVMPASENIFPIYLNIDKYSVPFDEIFKMNISGDFCTTKAFEQFSVECTQNRVTKVAKSLVTEKENLESERLVRESLNEDKDINLIMSASEDYINRVMATTVDFGLWDEMLSQVGLTFGDKGAQIRMNKSGKTATLYLDVKYKVKGFKGWAIRERNLRFPLALDVTVRVENIDIEEFNEATGEYVSKAMPHIIFNVFDVDLSERNLRYGIKKYDLKTSISNIRKIFRKKVIRMIKKELLGFNAPDAKHQLVDWKGTDVPPIPMVEISGLNLDKVDIHSDGLGRLILMMRKSKVLDYSRGNSLKFKD